MDSVAWLGSVCQRDIDAFVGGFDYEVLFHGICFRRFLSKFWVNEQRDRGGGHLDGRLVRAVVRYHEVLGLVDRDESGVDGCFDEIVAVGFAGWVAREGGAVAVDVERDDHCGPSAREASEKKTAGPRRTGCLKLLGVGPRNGRSRAKGCVFHGCSRLRDERRGFRPEYRPAPILIRKIRLDGKEKRRAAHVT